MSIDLVQVRTAKQHFYDIQSDLMRSKDYDIVNNLNAFVEFSERDPVLMKITQPLKENTSVDVNKWYEDIFKTGGSQIGSKRYALPIELQQEAALLYQFVLGIYSEKFN